MSRPKLDQNPHIREHPQWIYLNFSFFATNW